MPQRDRLASALLEDVALRSPTGLTALRDMVSLCQADSDVEIRPGLEPDKCQCHGSMRRRKLPRSAEAGIRTRDTYDWNHIYRCFKKAHRGFTELCFLCHEWFHGEVQWSEHCSSHLDRPDKLPVQCDPLVYGGVLANAGYCLFCMADMSLVPETRLRQFLDRRSWKDHVYGHYKSYVQTIGGKTTECPHPGMHCDTVFDSIEQLKFHILDCHCRDLIDGPNILDSSEQEDDVESEPLKRVRTRRSDSSVKEAKAEAGYRFVDETVETLRRHGSAGVCTAQSREGSVSLSRGTPTGGHF